MRKMIALSSVLLSVCVLAASARGQEAPAKMAVANPAHIFNEMQETKDLKQQMESQKKSLMQTSSEKQNKIKDLQEARNQLKPDSPQYAERNKELLAATIDFQTWGQIQEAELQRYQKQQTRQLFEKIVAAVQKVAERKGIDVVISERKPELPENLDNLQFPQLLELINQRSVLYADSKVTLDSEVIALLDAEYKAGKK
jgi:Skp family chaperone for outer membrane proteins